MYDSRRLLKIKIKSLAAESQIIRREELGLCAGKGSGSRRHRRKLREAMPAVRQPSESTVTNRNHLREELYLHRIGVVRRVARESLMAYGFIRGRSLAQVESKCNVPPNWTEVEKVVVKFGVRWDTRRESGAEYDARKADEARRFTAWRKGKVGSAEPAATVEVHAA